MQETVVAHIFDLPLGAFPAAISAKNVIASR